MAIRSCSACHLLRRPDSCSLSSAISLLSDSVFSESPSRLMASRSISSCLMRRAISSRSSGKLSICIRSLAAASSIRSIALSGRKRSVIYRSERRTAAIMASSCMRTLWWCSYFSLMPRRIDMVLNSSGSSTITIWKRLSRALSFSKYF